MGSSVVVTLALYTMLGVRQWFSKGQVAFFLCLYYLLGPKSFVFQSHGLTEIRKNALPSYK